MNRTQAFAIPAALALLVTGTSLPVSAYTGDDPVYATGIAACSFSDVQAHIGPSGAVTYKVYGSCAGATVSGQVRYSNGKFQESFIISNQAKISTAGYCDTDPWATAVNCHDQQVQSSGINYDAGLNRSAPLSLINGGQRFHEAFLHASRPNPPGIPVNLSATYALDPVNPGSSSAIDRVTATWLAPDASGDRPFLGFLMQVRPQNAEGAAWTDIGTIAWHQALDYRLSGKIPANAAIPAWQVRVCSTTALTMSCSPAQTPRGGELATKADSHVGAAAALFADQPAPVRAVARVKTDSAGPTMTICEAAAAARARNSPAAPGLEKQCAAQPAPLLPIDAAQLDELAAKGGPIAQADPLAAVLRAQQAEGAGQRGFDIGMAAAENDTLPGPGKQHIRDSLGRDERLGFDAAVTYLLERNSNKQLAATGADIAENDPAVAEARGANQDVFYQLGFDIATGLFGDPALGAQGNTLMGPGSMKIRDSLNAAGQNGFNDSVTFHQARDYGR